MWTLQAVATNANAALPAFFDRHGDEQGNLILWIRIGSSLGLLAATWQLWLLR